MDLKNFSSDEVYQLIQNKDMGYDEFCDWVWEQQKEHADSCKQQ